MRYLRALVLVVLCSAVPGGLPSPALAQDGRITVKSTAPFGRVAEALERAVADEKMGLVCHANAQRAAAGRGVTIKGNQVLMVFRNDFAVRLLAADPAAGFEAPIRVYVYENPDGTATVSYPSPDRRLRALSAPWSAGRGQGPRSHLQGDRRSGRGRALTTGRLVIGARP